MRKKIWRRALTGVLLLGSLCLAVPAAAYPDLPESHWAYQAMDRAAELQIINGLEGGRMAPEQQLTWGQLLTMLARGCDREDYDRAMDRGLSWDQAGSLTIRELGWLPERDFLDVSDLSRPVTRGETAALLERALPVETVLPEGIDGPALPVQEGLKDWAALEADYQMPVARLYGLGVIRGNEAGLFDGGQLLRRADGAVLLMRMLELRTLETEPVEPAGPAVPPEPQTPLEPQTPPEAMQPQEPAVPQGPLTELGENREKLQLLFGTTDRNRFSEKEEAVARMTEVTVPVWRLRDGVKTPDRVSLTVHQGVAAEVEAIFTEIFNDPEQFPIRNVGGFRWVEGDRGEHLCGTAIDINWEENYQVRDGAPLAGTHWRPGEDPYSIPENGSVVRIFADHGWDWGGDAWAEDADQSYGYHDYMHFSYLGT